MEILVKKLPLTSALLILTTLPAFAAKNPWVGTWEPNHAKSDYVEVNGPLIISTPSAGVMRWEYPSIQFRMQGKPDGSAMIIGMSSKPKGLVETVRLLTPTKLTYSVFVDGKLVKHGADQISLDGKTFTATSWIGNESKKRVEVFDKQ